MIAQVGNHHEKRPDAAPGVPNTAPSVGGYGVLHDKLLQLEESMRRGVVSFDGLEAWEQDVRPFLGTEESALLAQANATEIMIPAAVARAKCDKLGHILVLRKRAAMGGARDTRNTPVMTSLDGSS